MTLSKAMQVYHDALNKGDIQRAYRSILGFMSELRTELEQKYPDYVFSQVYPGYMDMSYFAITPMELRTVKLKVALVYLHEANRFELWLSANNRNLQKKWIDVLSQSEDMQYRVSEVGVGIDSIVEYIVHVQPNFDARAALKQSLEMNTLRFIKDMETRILDVQKENEHA